MKFGRQSLFIWGYVYLFLALGPQLLLAHDEQIGATSAASTSLRVVVPETIEVVQRQNGQKTKENEPWYICARVANALERVEARGINFNYPGFAEDPTCLNGIVFAGSDLDYVIARSTINTPPVILFLVSQL